MRCWCRRRGRGGWFSCRSRWLDGEDGALPDHPAIEQEVDGIGAGRISSRARRREGACYLVTGARQGKHRVADDNGAVLSADVDLG